MKKWTVVIEITEYVDGLAPHTQASINRTVSGALEDWFDGFQIFETIEAPYGPQHPNGVFIKEVENGKS